jgi:hypothetical protein
LTSVAYAVCKWEVSGLIFLGQPYLGEDGFFFFFPFNCPVSSTCGGNEADLYARSPVSLGVIISWLRKEKMKKSTRGFTSPHVSHPKMFPWGIFLNYELVTHLNDYLEQ